MQVCAGVLRGFRLGIDPAFAVKHLVSAKDEPFTGKRGMAGLQPRKCRGKICR